MNQATWSRLKLELADLAKEDPMDSGVVSLVNALNRLPNVATFSSCEGHGEHPSFHVAFFTRYGNFKYAAVILRTVLAISKEEGICLGCLQFSLNKDNHFDCANDTKSCWEIRISPRRDYGPKDARRDIDIIVAGVAKSVSEFADSMCAKENKA